MRAASVITMISIIVINIQRKNWIVRGRRGAKAFQKWFRSEQNK